MKHHNAVDQRDTEPKIAFARLLAETMMHVEEATLRCIKIKGKK